MSARAIATCNFRQQSSEIAYLHVGVRLYLHPSRSLAHYCLQIGSAVAGFSFAFSSSFLPPNKQQQQQQKQRGRKRALQSVAASNNKNSNFVSVLAN